MKHNNRCNLLLLALFLFAFTGGARAEETYSAFTADYGTGCANDDESFDKLVDDDTDTKWCVNSMGNPTYAEFHSDLPFVPTGYILTTGNDNED